MEVLGVIPARKGSTRIRNKNLQYIRGHPLIEWTIYDAISSHEINKVVVTTNDEKIINIANSFGIETIKRPKRLCNNYIHVDEAVVHTLNYLESKEDYTPDLVVLLQPTTPFRVISELDEGIKLCGSHDTVIFGTRLKNSFGEITNQ